jgi:hypothetical protein
MNQAQITGDGVTTSSKRQLDVLSLGTDGDGYHQVAGGSSPSSNAEMNKSEGSKKLIGREVEGADGSLRGIASSDVFNAPEVSGRDVANADNMEGLDLRESAEGEKVASTTIEALEVGAQGPTLREQERLMAQTLAESFNNEQAEDETGTKPKVESSVDRSVGREGSITTETTEIPMDKNPEEQLSGKTRTPKNELVLSSELSSRVIEMKAAVAALATAKKALEDENARIKGAEQNIKILGLGENTIAKSNQEQRIYESKVFEAKIKLQVEIDKLKNAAKGRPEIMRQLQNNEEAMAVKPIKEVIDNMKDEVTAIEASEDTKGQENVLGMTEAIIQPGEYPGAGLAEAIQKAVKKLSPELSDKELIKRTGKVFGSFATGILKELTEEEMPREEAVDAYKAMVQALEASNGVIEVVMGEDGEMRAHIINNTSNTNTP